MNLYAELPARRTRQVAADVVWAVLVVLAIVLGRTVTALVAGLADPARGFAAGADGLAAELAGAGEKVSGTPLVGDDLAGPLAAASDRAAALAAAGTAQVDAVEGWATVLGVGTALVLVLLLTLVRMVPRRRWARAAADARRLRSTPGGERLLALRALSTAGSAELLRIAPDPAAAWRDGDPDVVARLCAVQLRTLGLAPSPHPPPPPPVVDP